jgi:hypothetical protein
MRGAAAAAGLPMNAGRMGATGASAVAAVAALEPEPACASSDSREASSARLAS